MLLKNFMADQVTPIKGGMKIPMGGYINQMRERYEEMKKDTNKPFLHTCYTITPGDRTIVHVKIPSRSLKKFYYDVLLELDPPKGAKTIEDCHVKIFSNSPSFIFSVANTFLTIDPETGKEIKNSKGPGMIIGKLQNKLSNKSLIVPGAVSKYNDAAREMKPVVRNPYNLPLFDSSLYLAIIYLEDVTTLTDIQRNAKRITEQQMLVNVADFDSLMASRERVAKREKADAARQKKLEQNVVKTTEKNVRQANKIVHTVKPRAPIAAKKPIKAHSTVKPKTGR